MLALYMSVSVMLALGYLWLILHLLGYWHTKPQGPKHRTRPIQAQFSIIIPARNEAEHIQSCLQAWLDNKHLEDYVLEIIVIDDHSTDNTTSIVKEIDHPIIRLIDLSHFGTKGSKKLAVDTGVNAAKGNYIIQTDADCTVTPGYIKSLASLIQQYDIDLLAGSVKFEHSKNLFEHFQSLDMCGMMALTKAGIESNRWYLANGANLVYKKSLACDLDKSFASGDDVSRINQFAIIENCALHFSNDPNLTVSTSPEKTMQTFIPQRLRWGTKNKHTTNPVILGIMGLVFFQSLWFYIHIMACAVFGPIALLALGLHFFIKMTMDYLLLEASTKQYGLADSLKYFLPAWVIQQLYISLLGIASLLMDKYRWKGRIVQ
ncbi:MAG: glycosyltransferase [Saprospiraceae bacterium]|nr:glycosyltransferase [Saprospiraceae bacterium]